MEQTATQIGAVAISPTTGETLIVWQIFDAWWRSAANRSAARRRDANRVATVSANKIKDDAKKMSREEAIEDAKRLEAERYAAQRAIYNPGK